MLKLFILDAFEIIFIAGRRKAKPILPTQSLGKTPLLLHIIYIEKRLVSLAIILLTRGRDYG
jgi:hypothetical protein